MEKLIIVVGVNESVTKAENENVPISAEEMAADVAACVEAGASIFHFHTRDPQNEEQKLVDPQLTLDIYHAIRERTDAAIYPSYNLVTPDRFDHVHAAHADATATPDFAPVICGSELLNVATDLNAFYRPMDFPAGGSLVQLEGRNRTMSQVMEEIQICEDYDLVAAHEVWHTGHLRNIIALWKMGRYKRPPLIKFAFREDYLMAFPSETRYLEVYVDMIPPELSCEWVALPYGGIGYPQAMALWSWAITHGGNVRIGIGDNPSKDGFLPTNADRVRQMADLSRTLGRDVATVDDVRARFARLG
jgi:uncharacterized protein (DUF849 family)